MNIRRAEISKEKKLENLQQENEVLKQELASLRRSYAETLVKNSFDPELEMLLEKSNEAITIWDDKMYLLAMNRATLRIFPIANSVDELIGKNITEIHPQIESTPRYKIYQEVLQTGKSIAFNYHHNFTQDNEGRYFASEAFKVGNKLAIITSNVSRTKNLLDKLQQTERHLIKTQKLAEVGFWSYHIKSKEWFWSAETYRLLGYPKMETKPSLELFIQRLAPEEREIATKQFQNSKLNQFKFSHTYKIKIENKIKYLLCQGENRMNNSGEIVLREGVFQDITEGIQSQEALIQSEERFRLIADNIEEVFWLRTPNKILYINRAFERIWSIPTEKAYKDPSLILSKVHPEDLPRVKQIFEMHNTTTGTPTSETEFRIVPVPGETRWILAKTFSVMDQNKNPRIIGFATDITDSKQKEKELLLAKNQAEEGDKLKSSFLATMSHELRTPLNAVIGFSDLLTSDLPPEEINEFASTINRAGLQLLDIINNIFSVALLESQQINLKNMAFPLSEVVEEILPSIESNAQTCGKDDITIRYIKDHHHAAPSLFMDPKILKQIWTNLLDNAIKFTEKGHIHFGYKILDKKHIKFFVKDTGIGIPIQKQKLIFKKFMQLEDTHTRKFGGTGLGLAIVKKIVDLMNGQISVNSYPGRGSEFYFILSCLHTSPEPVASLSFTKKVDWSSKQILIVEDDEKSTKLISSFLSETHIQTLHTSKGEEVEGIIKNNPGISIVLMDLNLPKMNGFETTKLLRKFHPTVTVIAQTAYINPNTIVDIFASGCNDYLEKPYSKDDLLLLCDSYL